MPASLTLAQLSALDSEDFVAAVGAVFEHSPWVMRRAWARRPFADRAALTAALTATLQAASRDEQLALMCAHPELAGKAAIRGELTADSAREQAGAGLNACSPEEFAELQALNLAYRQRFGWPFIIAVTGLSRQDILAAMRQRLARAPESEFAEALVQIVRIANIRLNALLDSKTAVNAANAPPAPAGGFPA